MYKTFFLTLSLSTTMACTKSIGDDDEFESDGTVACADSVDGVTTTLIDSTSDEDWVYMDFELCETVVVEEPETELSWDIGLRRFNPKVNGGMSGSGGMEVATLAGVDFDSVTSAPADGYVTDDVDNDGDGVPDYALGTWFDYDFETHILTPKDQLYVIKTVEGNYVKLQFEDYYDEAGTSGFMLFSWAFIDAPGAGEGGDSDGGSSDSDGGDTDGGQTDGGESSGGDTDGGGTEGGAADGGGDPDASVACSEGTDLVTTTEDGADSVSVFQSAAGDTWVCFSFAESAQVSSGWDIAWKMYNTTVSTTVAGMLLEGVDYESLSDVPDGDWTTGAADFMADWYNYDFSTHIVTPIDQVYVLEDVDGTVWKLQITSYYSDGGTAGEPHYPTIRWAQLSGE